MNKQVFISIQLVIVCCIYTLSVHAANPPQPGAISEQSKQTLDYYEFKKRLVKTKDREKESLVAETPSKPGKTPQSSKKIHVSKIITGKSDILTGQEIREIVAPYEGRDITIAELFAVVNEINKLYKEKKYLSAKAVLPPQKVEVGVVKINLIEGRVGKVTIENNMNTREDFITDRIGVNKGSLVKLESLESELFYFNSVNDINIRAVLKPGVEFGTTDYILQIEEPEPYQTTYFADNSGTDDTGNERVGVTFINNSLTGERDVLTAGANVTQGIKSVFTSYNLPITKNGPRLGMSIDYTNVRVTQGELESLNIDGGSYNIGAFVTHPFMVRQSFLLNGFIGLNRKNSYSDFDKVTIFETDVGTLSFGVDSQHYGDRGALYSRHAITISKEGSLGSDKRFIKYNAELSKIIAMEKNVVALFRASAQLSNNELLPSSEQFQLGGMSTVRGYPSGLLAGDDGYFVSAEMSFPMQNINESLADNPYMDKWRGLMFFDHGAAYPFKGNNDPSEDSDYISSAGIGVNVNLSKALSARLVLAAPIKGRNDGADKPMLHFYVSYIVY